MPELPDVEMFKQYASDHALNQKIEGVKFFDERMLRSGKQKISKALKGNSFSESRRIGKYLLIKCNESWLVMHFGMTGSLKYFENGDNPPDYSQLVINFKNNHALAYISKRKLGSIEIEDDPEEFASKHEIGKDAMRISWEDFYKIMSNKKGSVKNALMNQGSVSGIGNIYTDEILFQEKIHPKTGIDTLDEDSLKSLYNSMKRIMRVAIRHQANPSDLPDTYLLSDRREGAECPACSGRIKKIKVNGRSTYFCTKCQKE